MKKTTENQPWSLALPSQITAEAVNRHLDEVAIAGESDPDLWQAHLESMRSHFESAIEDRYSEARSAVSRASQLPLPERIKARDEIRMALDAGRAKEALAMVSMRIIGAAVLAGQARQIAETRNKEASELEAESAAITAEMIKLQTPLKDNDAAILKVEKERSRIEAIGNDFSNLTNSEVDDYLKDLANRGKFKGAPNRNGYVRMLRDIESEIESLKSEDDGLLPPSEMMQRVGELRDRRDPIEARLRALRGEAASAETNKMAEIERMKSTLAACQAEALAIVLECEIDREVRELLK